MIRYMWTQLSLLLAIHVTFASDVPSSTDLLNVISESVGKYISSKDVFTDNQISNDVVELKNLLAETGTPFIAL